MNDLEAKIVIEYIDRLKKALSPDSFPLNGSEEIWNLIIEVVNAYKNKIPEMQNSVCLRNDTLHRDVNTVIALLKLYLANSGFDYTEEIEEENREIKRFWASFKLWFETKLVSLDLLKADYLHWDNWNGGTWYLNLDYDYEFRLHRGIEFPDSLKKNTGDIDDVKTFIELAYKKWIKSDGKSHYNFTVEVNERMKIFRLPYRLQNGILLKQGYKTTFGIDKILNYPMFERKIQFSEEMINSHDLMEKKSALDFLIDSLQYLVSVQEGDRNRQYAALAQSVNPDQNTKVYAVIKSELNELMKLSNDYFDIRHNDYLNGAKELREALNDSQFIEYLYNRAYSLLYLLRLKKCDNKECD